MNPFKWFKKKEEIEETESPITGVMSELKEDNTNLNNDTNLRLIIMKLDMLTMKIDNIDRRLQVIEEIAKRER